jgi:hypothetical protein
MSTTSTNRSIGNVSSADCVAKILPVNPMSFHFVSDLGNRVRLSGEFSYLLVVSTDRADV